MGGGCLREEVTHGSLTVFGNRSHKFSYIMLCPDPYKGWGHLQRHLQTHPLCGSLQVTLEKAIF